MATSRLENDETMKNTMKKQSFEKINIVRCRENNGAHDGTEIKKDRRDFLFLKEIWMAPCKNFRIEACYCIRELAKTGKSIFKTR